MLPTVSPTCPLNRAVRATSRQGRFRRTSPRTTEKDKKDNEGGTDGCQSLRVRRDEPSVAHACRRWRVERLPMVRAT
jgi:hypothetical protein